MATVNKLQLEIAALEADTRDRLKTDEFAQLGARMAFSIARVVAVQTILEMSVKGVIPEGRGGRILDALNTNIDASMRRVTQ